MSDKQTLLVILVLILLFLWFRRTATGTGEFAYVGFDIDGNPIPLVNPPELLMMEIPRTIPWSRW